MSHLFAAIVTILIVSLWIKLSANTKPAFSDEVSGLIRPGKTSAVITVFGGMAMFVIGLFAFFMSGEDRIFVRLLPLLGLTIAGFMAPSLGDWHNLSWNAEGVEGPCRMFGPSLSRKRTYIKWKDITSTGITATQYWYIETTDKRRIYWSYLYRGHAKFREALVRNRLDIAPPY